MPRSPRQVRKDVQETMTEHVRDLPINAVRLAMFGIGRALLLSDRLTKDYKEIKRSGVGPVLERWRNDAERVAAKVVERVTGSEETVPEVATPVARPPRKVNNSLAAEPEQTAGAPAAANVPEPVVITTAEPKPTAAEPEPEPKPTAAKPEPKPTAAKPEPKPEPVAKEPRPEPVAADALPVPSYDELTLASVRARLRSLNLEQVRLLRDYEQANAARADFLRMYVNRIAKLEGGR
jgi:outer membrane biosynthesis protein TonB